MSNGVIYNPSREELVKERDTLLAEIDRLKAENRNLENHLKDIKTAESTAIKWAKQLEAELAELKRGIDRGRQAFCDSEEARRKAEAELAEARKESWDAGAEIERALIVENLLAYYQRHIGKQEIQGWMSGKLSGVYLCIEYLRGTPSAIKAIEGE